MGKYLLRRILQMIPVVLGTTLLVYALVFALPGDPVKASRSSSSICCS